MGGGGSKGGGAASMPEVKPVEIPAPLPTLADEGVRNAGDEERRRRAAAKGASSTVLTGSSGLNTAYGSTANTSKKNLLGQ